MMPYTQEAKDEARRVLDGLLAAGRITEITEAMVHDLAIQVQKGFDDRAALPLAETPIKDRLRIELQRIHPEENAKGIPPNETLPGAALAEIERLEARLRQLDDVGTRLAELMTIWQRDHLAHEDFQAKSVVVLRAKDEEIAKLKEAPVMTKREAELMNDCTRLENERRHWKARAEASKELLTAALIDYPMTAILAKTETDYDPKVLKRVEQVHASNRALLKDAWCGAANLAREFVKEATSILEQEKIEGDMNMLHRYQELVDRWTPQFRDITA